MSPTEVVRAFVAAWNAGDCGGVFAALHPRVRYHNMPWAPVDGLEAVRANLLAFGIEEADWTLHHIAADGPVVLTERTDRVRVGGRWLAIRVMGTFAIEDGLIRHWRDYFDPAELSAPED